MFRSAIDIAGGVAAAVIAVCLGLVVGGADFSARSTQASLSQSSVNREAKGDMLPVTQPVSHERNRISVIEVIGVSDAAVVYRSRDGQLLFKTDPVSNVTVVAKNTVLPEITVRETGQNEIMPVPVEMPKSNPAAVRELPNTGTAPALGKQIPEGCESAFSTFLVPSQAKKAGRCLSSLDGSSKLSSLN